MSKPAAKPQRIRELARIHMLATELKLTDEQYRAVLWAQGRVDSARDLDEHGRRQVITHLQAHLERRPLAGPAPRSLQAKPMLRKIAAQLRAAGKDWHYAAAIATQMYDQGELDWLKDEQLRGVIAALDKDARRRA